MFVGHSLCTSAGLGVLSGVRLVEQPLGIAV